MVIVILLMVFFSGYTDKKQKMALEFTCQKVAVGWRKSKFYQKPCFLFLYSHCTDLIWLLLFLFEFKAII